MFRNGLVFLASVLTAGSILAGAASPAFAEPAAKTRVVSYADLDLTSAAGRARLGQRLDRAVRFVCGQAYVRDLNGVRLIEQCRDETLADAYGQVRLGEVQIAVAASLSAASAY